MHYSIFLEIRPWEIYITIEFGLCLSVCPANSSETARPIGLKLGEDVGLEASYKVNYF